MGRHGAPEWSRPTEPHSGAGPTTLLISFRGVQRTRGHSGEQRINPAELQGEFQPLPFREREHRVVHGIQLQQGVSAGQRQQRLRIHRSGHGRFPLGRSFQAYGPRRRWRMDDVSPRIRVAPCNGQRGGKYDVGKPFGGQLCGQSVLLRAYLRRRSDPQ